ncbi:MAG TPA: hypothetical protein VJ873_06635, partial [bacterium]|nr:hypothetical protein [bacterium]
MKVLLVYKESAYHQYLSSRQLLKNLKKRSYWSVVLGSHQRHNHTLEGVQKTLREKGLDVTLVLRDRVNRLGNVDGKFKLVVSV